MRELVKRIIKLVIIMFLFINTCNADEEKNSLQVVKKINIEGNKTTKNFIIERELTFNLGDTLSIEEFSLEVKRSKENLLKTSLFNYVTITSTISELDEIIVNILVEERWYTFPSLTLDYAERNFSEWLKKGDLSRTNYGGFLVRHNFRGRNEKIKFSVNLGYTKEFSLLYENIIFGEKKQHYMGGELALYHDDEITYSTINNKPVRYRSEKNYILERRKASINYTYRPAFYNKHKFYLNYYQVHINDTIPKLNKHYYSTTKSRIDELTLHYIFTHDKRNHKAYPLTGYYFQVFFEETIGLNNTFVNTYIKPEFNYYGEINKRFYYAAGLITKISQININSYFHSKAIGYDDNLRGYEPFVIDGQHFFLGKSLFKTVVLPTRITEFKFFPIKKFNKIHYALYFNIHFDVGYVYNKYTTATNSLDNTLLYSTGIGFDIVTYYDKVFRLEYAINRQGVKGYYISLKAPIN